MCRENVVKVTLKGGPGSGHRGHAGRPGLVGGSAPGITAGLAFAPGVSDDVKREVSKVYYSMPRGVRDLISEITVTDEKGFAFEAGGKEYTAGGSWNVRDGRISIYNSENIDTHRVIAHEAGHAIYDDWQQKAMAQGDKLIAMEHSGVDVLRLDGKVDPKVVNPKNYAEYELDADWDWARTGPAPEDGVTPYSKAWNNSTETFAEMHDIYNMHRLYGESPSVASVAVIRHATWEGAPTLGAVFSDVMDIYENK